MTDFVFNAGIVEGFELATDAELNPMWQSEFFDLPEMGNFWIPKADKTTRDGSSTIIALQSMKSTGGKTIGSLFSVSQPIWIDDELNGEPVMSFIHNPSDRSHRFDKDITGGNSYLPLETDNDGSWSKLIFMSAPAVGDGGPAGQIWDSAGGGDDNRHLLRLGYNANNHEQVAATLTLGAGPDAVLNRPDRPVDEYFLLVQSFDAVNGLMMIAINGENPRITAAAAADFAQTAFGSPLAGTSGLGATMKSPGFGWYSGACDARSAEPLPDLPGGRVLRHAGPVSLLARQERGRDPPRGLFRLRRRRDARLRRLGHG